MLFTWPRPDWISLDKRQMAERNCKVKRVEKAGACVVGDKEKGCDDGEMREKRQSRSLTKEPINPFPKRPLGTLGSLLCEQPGNVQIPASRIQIHIPGAHDPCAEPDLVRDVAEDDNWA